MLRLIVAIVISCTASIAIAQPVTANKPFFEDKARGWHWYEKLPEPAPEPVPEEKPVPESNQTPPPSPAIDPGPATLSNAWLKINIPLYLDAAIDDPTPENVAAFFYLQKVAMDKASAFADVSSLVVSGNQSLDENNRRPMATFANMRMDQESTARRRDLVNQLTEMAGIFYFPDNSEVTLAQNKVISALVTQFPFSITTIAAEPLTGANALPDALPNVGHSDMMGISTFPALVLVAPDGKFDVMSQAAVALPDLIERLSYSAIRMGLISQDDFNDTRTFRTRSIDIPTPITNQTSLPIPTKDIVTMMQGSSNAY